MLKYSKLDISILQTTKCYYVGFKMSEPQYQYRETEIFQTKYVSGIVNVKDKNIQHKVAH